MAADLHAPLDHGRDRPAPARRNFAKSSCGNVVPVVGISIAVREPPTVRPRGRRTVRACWFSACTPLHSAVPAISPISRVADCSR